MGGSPASVLQGKILDPSQLTTAMLTFRCYPILASFIFVEIDFKRGEKEGWGGGTVSEVLEHTRGQVQSPAST